MTPSSGGLSFKSLLNLLFIAAIGATLYFTLMARQVPPAPTPDPQQLEKEADRWLREKGFDKTGQPKGSGKKTGKWGEDALDRRYPGSYGGKKGY